MPSIPIGRVNLEIFIIVLLVGAAVFGFMFKVSNAQFSKKRDCQPEKAWSEWGKCTQDCEGGWQFRTRSVLALPANGGAQCSQSDLLQSQSCNTLVPCGQNCRPGNPSDFQWYPCPTCAEGNVQPVQWKIVPPLQTATYGGQDCEIDQVLLVRSCEGFIPPCPPNIDCQLKPYFIGPCSVPCGSGTQFVFSSISVFPSGNGAECPFDKLVTQQSCFLGPCNCDQLTWSGSWSECNAACGPGVQIMMRDPQPGAADALCPYFSISECQLAECPNLTCTAPSIDFVQAVCYLLCKGFSLEQLDLDPNICMSDEILNAVCGFNNPQVTQTSTWLGLNNCAAPLDCSLSSWSSFGSCSLPNCQLEAPYGGTQTRVRTIVNPGNSGGIPCVNQIFIDTQPCNNSVNVSYSAWNTASNTFVASVSTPTCSISDCEISQWYSVTGFLGGCGATCTQVWNRSITNPGSFPAACPTDPNFYVGTSTCCGFPPDVSPSPGGCGTLPTCTVCEWLTWTSLSLNCPSEIITPKSITIDAPLIQDSNKPGPSCFALGSQCSWDTIVATNPTWSQFSCSSFIKSCAGTGPCPIGCDGFVCSHHGFASKTTYSGGIVSCTCVCDPGFTGTACETALPRCPIASVSGLECNGLGSCNNLLPFTCSCNNPNDTTPDCTGSSTSWCWIYGVIDGNLNPTSALQVNTVRKLLGAIPIASTTNFTFTEQMCLSISEFGSLSANSLTVVQPQPVLFGMNAPFGITNTIPATNIKRMFLQTTVSSAPPKTLVTQNTTSFPASVTHFCRDFSSLTTQDLLSLTFGTSFSKGFIPKFMPGSSPVQCESLFTLSNFLGASNMQSQLSLSTVSATGPQPPQFVATGFLSCTDGQTAVLTYTSPASVTGLPFAPSIELPPPVTGQIVTLLPVPTFNSITFTATAGIPPPSPLNGFTVNNIVGPGGWPNGVTQNEVVFSFPTGLCTGIDGNTTMVYTLSNFYT